MAGSVHIPWYATVFRGDKFEIALMEIAPVSPRRYVRSAITSMSASDVPTSSAVKKSVQCPAVRTTSSSARKRRALRRSSGRSPTTSTTPTSTPSRRNSSANHGPLRSLTRPVSTSVPVTTIPARTATRPTLVRPGPARVSCRAAGRPATSVQ